MYNIMWLLVGGVTAQVNRRAEEAAVTGPWGVLYRRHWERSKRFLENEIHIEQFLGRDSEERETCEPEHLGRLPEQLNLEPSSLWI